MPIQATLLFFFQYYTWKLKLRGFSRLFLILYVPSNDHVEKCVNEHESHCPGNAESVDWRGWLHCSAHLETNIVLLQPEQHLHSETHARVGEDTRGKKHSSVYYMQGVGNYQLMGKKWTYGVAGNFQGVQFLWIGMQFSPLPPPHYYYALISWV